MAKRKKTKRKRSTAEKVMIVLGILIALSMIFSLIVGLGGGGSSSTPSGGLPVEFGEPIASAIVDGATFVGAYLPGATGLSGFW